jgi:mono/diheme cytochrome c family protein
MRRSVVSAGLVLLLSGMMRFAGAAHVEETTAITLGKEVYRAQRCQICHSIAGVGNRRYPLDGVGSRLSEADIRQWIVAPRKMDPKVTKKAFDQLPAGQLDALVAYLQSLEQ